MSNNDKFDKVLNKSDVFVLAFGAMIGWGWVILSGEWIQTAGTLGRPYCGGQLGCTRPFFYEKEEGYVGTKIGPGRGRKGRHELACGWFCPSTSEVCG